ncbi:hypothetical protein EDC94DRAFT_658865 [Helicostylum pulchrum]|nr:hypothetical protein EDC94DRAFT_658865 [Helicostylum pulchrum]
MRVLWFRYNHNEALSLINNNQYFKHSYLTTTLVFRETRSRRVSYTFNRLELLEILNQLPNLEIDFKLVYNPEEYVGYLLDADMQHINHIDIGFNLCDIRSDLLFSVYYKFLNSLTCISLVYDRNRINSRKTNISNLLTRFKKLTKLELYNRHDINLTPFQIQDSCPNLELLVFDSLHPISDSGMQHILDDNRRINLNFISSLTCLNLCLPSLSAMYTRYLVDYFPNQLTDLHITISRQNIFNWIEIVGMDLALRLMEKAGGIDGTYVRFILREEYQERANDENNMTKYFKLLNLIFCVNTITMMYIEFLNYSLSNCPRLRSLNIKCDISGSLYHFLSLRPEEGRISSDQKDCDINLLQMEHIRPTENLLDLVTTHLHNIEIVSLKAADWSHKFQVPVIDLTRFKKLKSFNYTSTYSHFTKEHKFILIKYTNGTKEQRIIKYGGPKGDPSFTVLCDISVSLDSCASTT